MRGMKKWLPFKSLSGQYEILDEHEKEREKVDRPDLSEEEIEEINAVLCSLKKGDIVYLSYYDEEESRIIQREKRTFLSCEEYAQYIRFKEGNIAFRNLLALEPWKQEESFEGC